MEKGTILITGGTGLVGTAFRNFFIASGYRVTILTRDAKSAQQKAKATPGFEFAEWDIKKGIIEPSAIQKAIAIIHLAGAGVVDKPWTKAYKKEILDSRVNSSALIVKALKQIPNKIQTVISASAIGWYGPDKPGHEAFSETDPAEKSFLGETCQAWENSIQPVTALNKRLVVFRFGIILSKEGGALKEFIKPLKVRVASVLGNGNQIVSWIHIHDLCRMVLFAIENDALQGVFNAVAPAPVSNETLTITLARQMHGNAYVKVNVPQFVLKMMLGERSVEVLKSATVSSQKIERTGFEFQFPEIEHALANIVKMDN
jgi:uncharacterized protein (TIGR01777 family)